MRRVTGFFLCLLLAGCGGGSRDYSQPATARQVRIDWLGNQTFLFTSSIGLKVLVNPHADGTGGPNLPRKLDPDVLLVTMEKPAFNAEDSITNTPTAFRGAIGAGLNNASGIRFRGVPTYTDAAKGENMNLVFSWAMEGIRFCFTGNIPGPLTSEEVAQLGQIDVLFLPVGQPSYLADEERNLIVTQLHPKVVVPMGSPGAIESWIAGRAGVHRLTGPSVLLNAANLPGPTILVFAP
ncbi:MAG: hypothetical protein BGO12_04120 [Verrucomicrobia bacterium 61-8]|nr:MBL fold metallo-hydrolase [Verrucomicrobiota bacterium]OJU98969.1 MAG: hypothetical protein BGO12_04120 [Verrucomicrobia bacterium 61-8]